MNVFYFIVLIGGAYVFYYFDKDDKKRMEETKLVKEGRATEAPVFEFLYMLAREGRWPYIISPLYLQDIHNGFEFNAETRTAVFLLRLCTTDRQPLSSESATHLGTVIQADLKWAFSHGELSYLPKVVSVYNERGSVFIKMEVTL